MNEQSQKKMYHSVFYKHQGKWKHHVDADNAEDARLERNACKNDGEQACILRVPQHDAQWHRKSAEELHSYVEKRLKGKTTNEGYDRPRYGSNEPGEGDSVRITMKGNKHAGKIGTVHQTAPSGHFHGVSIAGKHVGYFHSSDLTRLRESDIEEKYIGFKKLAAEKGAALAAYIGRKKYGAKKFNHAAAAHHKLKHDPANESTALGRWLSETRGITEVLRKLQPGEKWGESPSKPSLSDLEAAQQRRLDSKKRVSGRALQRGREAIIKKRFDSGLD